mmetsp:Transcript_1697/g.2436  ORF Transcript_1697/g.2436 Transcript_1697/m.2436 type:complete len:169 (-) Transcript_1697:366-872(-)
MIVFQAHQDDRSKKMPNPSYLRFYFGLIILSLIGGRLAAIFSNMKEWNSYSEGINFKLRVSKAPTSDNRQHSPMWKQMQRSYKTSKISGIGKLACFELLCVLSFKLSSPIGSGLLSVLSSTFAKRFTVHFGKILHLPQHAQRSIKAFKTATKSVQKLLKNDLRHDEEP